MAPETRTASRSLRVFAGVLASLAFAAALSAQTALTVTGITATSRHYDGTTVATLDTSGAALSGTITTGDDVRLVVSGATGAFADANVGTNKVVTIIGVSLIGAQAANYTLVPPTTTASITAKSVAPANMVLADKVYDGTTIANVDLSGATLSGAIAGDAVSLSTAGANATYASKNVGTNKTVTLNGLSLTGAAAGNYTLFVPTLTLSITAKSVTATGVAATNKVYDATAQATLDFSAAAVSGAIAGDAVSVATSATGTFADKAVGAGKSVAISGLALTGADAGNYSLTATTATATANITAKGLTVSGVTTGKVYDGSTAATLNTSAASLVGIAGSDAVTLATAGASASFADKNVGSGKAVSVSGLSLSGADAGNYALTQPTVTGSITALALSVSGITASSKVYDATTTALLDTSGAALSGAVAGDAVSLVTTTAAGAFANKSVGNAKVVNISGLTLSGADAGNYSLTLPTTSANITAKNLTVSGITATKVYDAATAVTLNTSAASLVGVVGTDSVSASVAGASANFSDKNVGSGKAVTVSGVTLSGADASNYTLTQPAVTGSITAKSVTVTGIAASAKVYDATTAATLDFSAAAIAGALAGDAVSVATAGVNGTFADKSVGNAKTVTISGVALSGADAPNYTLTGVANATAAITARALTASGVNVSDKVYDGNGSASLVLGGATLVGVISGDTVGISGGTAAFADKTVGTGKAVSISLALNGADAGNYSLTQPSATASISARGLTVSGVTATKVYDGTVAAPLSVTGAALVGVVNGDAVSLSGAGASGTFADKAVGAGKTVTTSGFALSGADAGNYSLAQPSAVGAITAKTLTVSGVTAANKIYDATLSATVNVSGAALVGAVGGDDVTLSSGAASGAFATKTVNIGKTVTISGLALSGADAGNYALTQPTTTADITAKNLSLGGVSVASKIYDGLTTATLDLSGAALGGLITGDVVALASSSAIATFADRTVGVAKTITLGGFALSGADSANYSLSLPTITGNITAKALTVTGVTAANRTYDGTKAATLNFTAAVLNGQVSSDDVSLVSTSAVATFADKNVGTAKAVAISGLTLSGADAANYSVTQPATSANITPLSINLTGLIAKNRVYNGATNADLDVSGAALVGVIAGDTVTVNVSVAAGTFADANSGRKAVTLTGLTLGGSSAGNYTLIAPALSAEITRAKASLAFSNLRQVYDGKAKTVQVSSVPAGLKVNLTFSQDSPVNAGSYGVTGAIDDINYEGTSSDTLIVDKANQTITFPTPGGCVLGKPVQLSATASSGLPVTLSVVSGSCSYSNGWITLSEAGSVSVRATQAGDSNYNAAASVTVTVSAGKTAQSIQFASVATHGVADAPITLSATSSSGLPVTFTLVSGPASLSGNTLTFSGAPGTITIRATQNGDGQYGAADVTMSFSVVASAPVIYFGSISSGTSQALSDGGPPAATLEAAVSDSFAAQLSSDFRAGTMIGQIAGLNEAFVVAFQPDANGSFVATTTTMVPGASGVKRVFRGQISGTTLSGSIDGLNVTYSATVQAPMGATAGLVGYYNASAIGTSGASTHAIVAANGRAFVLAVTPRAVEGASAVVTAGGLFNATTAANTVISGTIDSANTGVNATVAASGQPAMTFAGLKSGAIRTDRLVNLSSRAVVGAASRILISGFVVSGANPKAVMIRAVGPGLAAFGIRGPVSNPQLSIYKGTTLIAQNRGWSTATNATEIAATAARVGAFALTAGSSDSVVLVTLDPGSYTAQVSNPGSDAVALAEIYDASTSAGTEPQRLVNVSTRGLTDTGENILIGGFVVSGNSPKTVLIRGVGPALAAFGVDSTVADPVISVYQNTTLIGQNDNWDADAAAATRIADASQQTGAFKLTAGSKDAALLLTLAPGSYTAQVAGKTGSGVALVEIYEVP